MVLERKGGAASNLASIASVPQPLVDLLRCQADLSAEGFNIVLFPGISAV